MAFNATYETVYGFDLLDTAHNFFPELLYDEAMFVNPILSWMRYRVSTLFSSVYARQKSIYNIYLARERMEQYNAYRALTATRTPMVVTPLSTRRAPVPVNIPATLYTTTAASAPPTTTQTVSAPSTTTASPSVTTTTATTTATTATTATPVASARAPHLPQAPPAPAQVHRSRHATNDTILLDELLASFVVPNNSLLQSLFNIDPNDVHIMMPRNLNTEFQNLASQWTDVPVIPTTEQINRGSELIPSERVSAETACTICQDHGAEVSWRRLYCNHEFHTLCIDRWFRRNTHCPVCRADIRDFDTNQENQTPTTQLPSTSRTLVDPDYE